MDKKTTTELIIRSALQIAEKVRAVAIFVSGDINVEEIKTSIPIYTLSRRPKSIIDNLVSSNSYDYDRIKTIHEQISRENKGNLQHIEQAAAVEYIVGKLRIGTIVALIQMKDSTSIIIHRISESPLIKLMRECEGRVSPEIMRTILNIAFDIAATGREGRKVGTAFILGDSEEVMQRSHQMIINPYIGQKDEDCNLLDKNNWESIKELALLDGSFIISEDGLVHAAGRYLDVDAKDLDIEKGLGGRHVSAAAITRDTFAIAITISESGGIIRVYMDGKEMLYLDSIEKATRTNNCQKD